MNSGGLHLTPMATVLIAVGLFFVGGVIAFIKQGLKVAAVLSLLAAVLALTGGVLRL